VTMGGPHTRRRLLTGGLTAGAAALALTGLPAGASAALFKVKERHLSFRNLHTDEILDVRYYIGGRYEESGLRQLNHALRDWRTGEVAEMDTRLLDTLWLLRQRLGSRRPFDLISGYRSPKTNAMLAGKSSGVAKKSYHMRAMAVDVALPDVRLANLRDEALDMAAGGVGYYARSGFVHVDVGPVRRW